MGWLFEDKGTAKAAQMSMNAAQEEARKKLEKVELLYDIMQDWVAAAAEECYGWMCNTKGYGDSLKRMLVVTKDGVFVLDCNESELTSLGDAIRRADSAAIWAPFSERSLEKAKARRAEANAEMEKLSSKNGCFFKYTGYGYLPLDDYRTSAGNVVGSHKLLEMWASIVSTAARKQFPTLKFAGEPKELSYDIFSSHAYGISYTVPDYPWKNWF